MPDLQEMEDRRLPTFQVRIQFATHVPARPSANTNPAEYSPDKGLMEVSQGKTESGLRHKRMRLVSAVFHRKDDLCLYKSSPFFCVILPVQVQCVRRFRKPPIYDGNGQFYTMPKLRRIKTSIVIRIARETSMFRGSGIINWKSYVRQRC